MEKSASSLELEFTMPPLLYILNNSTFFRKWGAKNNTVSFDYPIVKARAGLARSCDTLMAVTVNKSRAPTGFTHVILAEQKSVRLHPF